MGFIYVTGGFDNEIFLQKYERGGNVLWSDPCNGLPYSYGDAQAIAVDGAGYIYLTGTDGGALIKLEEIPEPSTISMLLCGFAGLAGIAVRKMRK
jgi:hypothetical protein